MARWDIVRYGRRWEFLRPQTRSGNPMPHWSIAIPSRGANSVEVYPPNPENRCWAVTVDGVEVLEITGPRAKAMAFEAAEAFAQQRDPLQTVLRDQQFCKRDRRKRRRR